MFVFRVSFLIFRFSFFVPRFLFFGQTPTNPNASTSGPRCGSHLAGSGTGVLPHRWNVKTLPAASVEARPYKFSLRQGHHGDFGWELGCTLPKRFGTKCYERYERYKGARTVQDALASGSRKDDLRWDAERGFCEFGDGIDSLSAGVGVQLG